MIKQNESEVSKGHVTGFRLFLDLNVNRILKPDTVNLCDITVHNNWIYVTIDLQFKGL